MDSFKDNFSNVDKCPKCGSYDLKRVPVTNRLDEDETFMNEKNKYGSYVKVLEDLSYKIINGRCLKCGN